MGSGSGSGSGGGSTAPPPPASMSSQAAPQIDLRSQLLESIKGFQGFQNPGGGATLSKPPVTQNRVSDPPPSAGESSILDQLKNELLKRAQFLSMAILIIFHILSISILIVLSNFF